MAETPQLIGGRQAGRAGTDDEHALAALLRRRREAPSALDRLIAEKALDRVDADGLVDLRAVATGFAWVIADPAHDRRHRIVLGENAPGAFVIAGLGVKQPVLDIFTGRAGMIARRQPVHINRPFGAPGARVVGKTRSNVKRDGERVLHQMSPSAATRLNSAILRSAMACSLAMRRAPSRSEEHTSELQSRQY